MAEPTQKEIANVIIAGCISASEEGVSLTYHYYGEPAVDEGPVIEWALSVAREDWDDHKLYDYGLLNNEEHPLCDKCPEWLRRAREKNSG